MLTAWNEYDQDNVIGSDSVIWGRGGRPTIACFMAAPLMTKWQAMYGQGRLLADATSVSGGVFVKDLSLISSGVFNTAGALTNNGVLISDGYCYLTVCSSLTAVLLSDGVLIGDGVLISDGVLYE